ncbi:MAG: hypothetical protein LBC88_02765 [Spirochaetaceae bacterium]|jgi:hypothetical protein|nr:hypothetical protein [Spirochaetaceae bacterium]
MDQEKVNKFFFIRVVLKLRQVDEVLEQLPLKNIEKKRKQGRAGAPQAAFIPHAECTDNGNMEILLYVLPPLALAGLSYVALARTSGPAVRRAARIALFLAALSLLVCSVILALRPGAGGSAGGRPLPDAAPVRNEPAFDWKLLAVLGAAALIFVIIIALAAKREKQRVSGIAPHDGAINGGAIHGNAIHDGALPGGAPDEGGRRERRRTG